MKRFAIAVLLLVLAACTASAQKKNKKHDQVPAVFEHAHFIYVEAAGGDSRFGVDAGDQQAVSDVQDILQDWNRYVLAHRRRDADVVLVVSKGRVASGRAPGGVSVGPPMPSNQGSNRNSGAPGAPGQPAGGWGNTASIPDDVGSDTDRIRVYQVSSDGNLTGPLWTLQLDHGLDAPPVALMQRLRTAVENAYPSHPAPTQPAPTQPPSSQTPAPPQPQQP